MQHVINALNAFYLCILSISTKNGKPLKPTMTQKLKNVKKLGTEFADVTKEPQGLLPRPGIFYHKISLTAYPKRERRNRLSVPKFEKLNRQCSGLLFYKG